MFALLCVAAAAAYVVWAVLRDAPGDRSRDERAGGRGPGRRGIRAAGGSDAALHQPYHGQQLTRNRAAVVPLESPEGPRGMTRLVCRRIHFAGGRGLCLGEGGGTAALEDDVIATHAYVFGTDFQINHDVSLGGFPSRARISPDGRYGATTVFVSGHSYARRRLLDRNHAHRSRNRRQSSATSSSSRCGATGSAFQAIDFNFWGVTFAADSDRFYATLATGGRTYLVEGAVGAPAAADAAGERGVPLAVARRQAPGVQETGRRRCCARSGAFMCWTWRR